MNMKLPNVPTNLTLQTLTRTEGMVQGRTESVSGIYGSFAQMLDSVNQNQLEAENKQAALLTSTEKDIHGTMIALEKADISMRLMLQIRNKLVSAYEEIMRMQV